jgi:TolB-like protein/class 3 adenylate cyclase
MVIYNYYQLYSTFLLRLIRSYLKNTFWPNFFVDALFKILEIPTYACGFKLGPAAKLNQNPIFEMASINLTIWDQTMPKEGLKRKLAAILSADVEGYSRLMGNDEAGTIRTLTAYKEAMSALVIQHRGRVVDAPGDNMLAEFASVVDAVQCAVEIQRELAERNEELPAERKMVFRIGVNLGDVVEEKDRIYGDGVNIAARLESICDGGGVCISGTAFEHVGNKLKFEYEDLGDHEVKNIEKPVRVYRVLSYPGAAAHRVTKAKTTVAKKFSKMLVAAMAILVVVAAAAVWHFHIRPPMEVASVEKTAISPPDKPSIAVLPFDNLSDDPRQEYFADGMTDELITDLSKISGLLVISRNSSSTYKGKTVNVRQVAQELNVRYVLEGSIQRAGNRVRIRAQLIDGTTDHHMWAESYDGVMENIFDLQDEITQKIAAVLAVKLTATEQNRFANKETANIEAYDAFVKGWEHLHRETADDIIQAISFFKEAIELDPMYSRAHAALAWTYLRSTLRFGWTEFPIAQHYQTRLMARKHLELAMRNPSSTAHLVASKMALQRREYKDSVTQAQLALAFDANDPYANLNMARVLMATGKPKEGLDYVNKTIQLDPRNMAASFYAAGLAHFIMGDLQNAATMTERAINHNPTIVSGYEMLSAIYALLGRKQDAQAAYDKGLVAWDIGRFPAELITVMSFFLVKDPQVADRYADGLAKAGWPGKPSDYYKIFEENRLTGEEIRKLVSGLEITVYMFGMTFWIVHSENGRLVNISRAREGKWWIEGEMLCYQMESGRLKGLNDCGEIYRNPDSLPGSKKQYLHVKDYAIAALSTQE